MLAKVIDGHENAGDEAAVERPERAQVLDHELHRVVRESPEVSDDEGHLGPHEGAQEAEDEKVYELLGVQSGLRRQHPAQGDGRQGCDGKEDAVSADGEATDGEQDRVHGHPPEWGGARSGPAGPGCPWTGRRRPR